jgi:hypothetical protein
MALLFGVVEEFRTRLSDYFYLKNENRAIFSRNQSCTHKKVNIRWFHVVQFASGEKMLPCYGTPYHWPFTQRVEQWDSDFLSQESHCTKVIGVSQAKSDTLFRNYIYPSLKFFDRLNLTRNHSEKFCIFHAEVQPWHRSGTRLRLRIAALNGCSPRGLSDCVRRRKVGGWSRAPRENRRALPW